MSEPILVPEPLPDHFPMPLGEYTVLTRLDPLVAAALARFVGGAERLKEDWDALVSDYRARVIK